MDKRLSHELFKGHLETVLLRVINDDGPIHGTMITRTAHQRSGGHLPLNAGSIYQTLHRLAERGHITGATAPSAIGGAPVVQYQITDTEKVRLEHRIRIWHKLLQALSAFYD